MTTRSRRVYLCHPIATYGTGHARAGAARLGQLLPGATLVDPEDMGWPDDTVWLDTWAGLLDELAALVVLPAPDGTLGAGCLLEIVDAARVGIPLAVLDPAGGGLVELTAVCFLPFGLRTPHRTARVVTGGPVDPADLLGPGGVMACLPGGRAATVRLPAPIPSGPSGDGPASA
jgi:hypothetical protein